MCLSRSPEALILDLFRNVLLASDRKRVNQRLLSGMKRRGNAAGPCGSLSLENLCNRDDYIALFVPFFDIPVGLCSLFQRIASIDDRSYLSFLDKLFKED